MKPVKVTKPVKEEKSITRIFCSLAKVEKLTREGWKKADLKNITDKKFLDNLKINQDLVLMEKEQ